MVTTYVVGDVQGCRDGLRRLLRETPFAATDRLWLVGDLVNRGPQSAEVLRFLRDLGPRCTAVLGNHDFYLLALAAGMPPRASEGDTLHDVLDAPDAAELIDWLRQRPFLHVEGGWAMVHAGLLPQWSIAQAQALANEVETQLRGPQWREFLLNLWGAKPVHWEDDLSGWDRLRVVVNAMARMRFLTPEGGVDVKTKGPPEKAPPGAVPWYDAPAAAWRTHRILCGHWSALGFRDMGQVIALDSGCVWGGQLTAYRLDDGAVFQVDCPQASSPSGWD